VTPTDPGPRRLHRRRAVGPQVLMLVAGVAGLVLTLAVLRPGAGSERVAIAVRDLDAGTVLSEHDVRFESVAASERVADRYVSRRELSGLRGRVLTVPVFADEPLLEAHLRARAATDGRRAMSIPVDRARAVNGISKRIFNLVVTNVPGPQVPLYAAGARMLETYPVVPLADGQGLAVGITSYDGGLFYGFNADRDALPDVDVLAATVDEAFDELRGR